MGKFNFNEYLAKEASKKQEKEANGSETTEQTGPKTEFLNKILVNDGDYVIVRFPYKTTDEFDVVHTHSMKFGGNPYPQAVECKRNDEDPIDKCPLCKAGEKINNRFFVKAIAYIADVDENGQTVIRLLPVVWDRPFGYAKELASKLTEYDDGEGLRNYLFKIKRSGQKTDTTYSTDVVLNKSVYNPEVYKSDFSLIEKVDPSKLLLRSMDKYLAATSKKEEPAKEQPKQEVKKAQPVAQKAEPVAQKAAPKAEPTPAPVQPQVKAEPAQTVQQEEPKQTKKRSYSFN